MLASDVHSANDMCLLRGAAQHHIYCPSPPRQVGSYARHYRYSPAEQADVSDRLQAVTRLLKQHDCADSGQLLDAAARAEASLETWFHAEGAALDTSMITQSPVCR
jgi:hypothetical protein